MVAVLNALFLNLRHRRQATEVRFLLLECVSRPSTVCCVDAVLVDACGCLSITAARCVHAETELLELAKGRKAQRQKIAKKQRATWPQGGFNLALLGGQAGTASILQYS